MKDISQATVLVRDNGMFFPIAQRLAKDFKRVLYFTDYERAYAKINDACLGDGFDNIERVSDLWEVKNEVDCFVYPDIGHSGEQLELRSQSFPVWGCGGADEQELDRELFLTTLLEIGLEVPKYRIVVGLSKLREYLGENPDKYIKVSRYRGSFETFHFRSMEQDGSMLNWWGVKLGPLAEQIRFIVFDPIKTDLEIGIDFYCIDGRFPQTCLHGIEWKDKSYFAAVTKKVEMPEQVLTMLEAYGPVLGRAGHRGFFSAEVRVKDDVGYFIDPTPRGGLPSTASQIALWSNYSEIIYAGAHGELVEPEPVANFSAESIVKLSGENPVWKTCEDEPKLEDRLMLTGCCRIGDVLAFPTSDDHGDEVGWLVSTGDTQEETIEAQNEAADKLPDGMDANTECLAYVLKEIHEAAKEGIEFSDEPTPKPSTVMES